MVTLDEIADLGLLQKPSEEDRPEPLQRTESNYTPLHTFLLPKQRQYQQQFADIYFLRLTKIKPFVEDAAIAAWKIQQSEGKELRRLREYWMSAGRAVLGRGTVYMDMSLKPSILEDVAKDRWISAPTTVSHYYSEEDQDSVTLEDDSGRIKLVGDAIKNAFLVTGCIIAVLGTENANGEMEVIDLKFADLPPQPARWSLSSPKPKDEDIEMTDSPSSASKKIALVSGLEFSGNSTAYAAELNLLLEFLLGEALDPSVQSELSQISRLIIAGNSIAKQDDAHHAIATSDNMKKPHTKKYGYDASSYNPLPSQLLDTFMAELLPTIPITLLPGANDPANASYPQQPIHSAMFPKSRTYSPLPLAEDAQPGWLDMVTNPWEGEVEGWRVLGTGGQNLDDICRYVDSTDRLGMMEAMCRWRCSAPTAPDTLWAYPFQDDEPFVIKDCPHLYFVGCQPEFGTKTIEGSEGQMVRLIMVPSFTTTKEIVLVDTETLDVTRVKISA